MIFRELVLCNKELHLSSLSSVFNFSFFNHILVPIGVRVIEFVCDEVIGELVIFLVLLIGCGRGQLSD